MSAEEPLFLTRLQIERLHYRSIMKFGGSAGVGDESLIQSALASAKNAYFYGRGDLFKAGLAKMLRDSAKPI